MKYGIIIITAFFLCVKTTRADEDPLKERLNRWVAESHEAIAMFPDSVSPKNQVPSSVLFGTPPKAITINDFINGIGLENNSIRDEFGINKGRVTVISLNDNLDVVCFSGLTPKENSILRVHVVQRIEENKLKDFMYAAMSNPKK